MTTLEHEIRIGASKERVFATLANLELVQEYNPSVLSAKYISTEHRGVGAARECDLGSDGGMIRERVTGFEDGKAISMELYEHNWPLKSMHWTTRVEPDGTGTLVTQSLDYEVKFGLIGALLDKLAMKNKMNTNMNVVFDSMKAYIENEG